MEDLKIKAMDAVMACTDPVVLNVVIKQLHRSVVGVDKYGVTLADAGLTKEQRATHAQEEIMDFINYLEVLKGDY